MTTASPKGWKLWGYFAGSALTSMGLGLLLAREAHRLKMRKMQEAKTLAHKWTGVFPHVAPETVLTIVGIESSFNPGAENHSERAAARGGAWGYMQMTLDTARDLVPRMPKSLAVIGKFDDTGRSLLDPDLNIAVGTFYLDRLAVEFKDFDLVVAAYQQGPGKIRQLLHSGVSPADIVKQLGPHGQQYVAMAHEMKNRIEEGTV